MKTHSSVTLLQGDCRETLKTIAPKSVQCVVTSPPYYGLRDYGTAKWVGGDPNCNHQYQKGGRDPQTSKKQISNAGTIFSQYEHDCKKCGAKRIDEQIGLEKTPEEYVQNLVEIFRLIRIALKDDGTVWLNLGDSYWGGKGASSQAWSTEHQDRNTLQKAQHQITGKGETRPTDGKHPVIKPKDLIGIPWMVAFALRADGWYLRRDIIWSKDNPMPESVTDRCTTSHEYIFHFSKNAKYYYDQDAIREPYAEASMPRALRGLSDDNKYAEGAPGSTAHTMSKGRKNVRKEFEKEHGGSGSGFAGHSGYTAADGRLLINPLGRNKWSVWNIPTKSYREAHFATFPPDLIEPCILAGTSAKGECPKCGKAWIRITERTNESNWEFRKTKGAIGGSKEEGNKQQIGSGWSHDLPSNETITIGWQPQCECNAEPVPQIVLDPFSGSGTTGAVSLKHNRKYIGCELNPEYIEMTHKRFKKVQYYML